jgi:glycosyltransferase involved in cell wall biosynthesis
MRVLFISPFAGLGGAERCLLDMLAALGDPEPRVQRSAALLADGPLVQEIQALGVPTEVLALPERLRRLGESGGRPRREQLALAPGLVAAGLGYAFAFERLIARSQPDIVHSNGMKAHLLAAALARRSARVVLHLHDFIGRRRFSRHVLGALSNEAVTVVAPSRAVADDCQRTLPRARVELVYNAIDTAAFSPGQGEPEWLAELAGKAPPEPGTLSFALVATYARWKGHDVYLRAAARALARDPGLKARFYIVGGPIYETDAQKFDVGELGALADQLGLSGHVAFVPWWMPIRPETPVMISRGISPPAFSWPTNS